MSAVRKWRMVVVVLMLLVIGIGATAYADGVVTVTITSGPMTSITPTRIDLTHNGDVYGGQNPVNPAWSIPAGGNTDTRAFTVTGISAEEVNDFHMEYSASGSPKQITIAPIILGEWYPLADTGGSVRAYYAASSIPTSSEWGIVVLIVLMLSSGILVLRRRGKAPHPRAS